MRRRPIGQILVEKGEISPAELQAALDEQERTGLKLGQILIETGRISWLALARAIAEQVLDIEQADAPEANGSQAPAPAPAREPAPAPGLPPLPTFTPVARPAQATQPAQPLQAAPPPPPVPVPAPQPAALELLHDPEIKLHSVEALLKERQRAFIELVTTTETLRMKVARLEEIIDERDRELTKLRVLRAG
ncbi:MAG: hypothetical protein QOH23_861 [Gaiellaceae bacterium]|nr:hypothetical protein [Gaiellaceae bacterium]